jgi:hypothetical protein
MHSCLRLHDGRLQDGTTEIDLADGTETELEVCLFENAASFRDLRWTYMA